MVGTSDNDLEGAALFGVGAGVTSPELPDWFVREVLPLEAALMHFLRRSWRNQNEVADLCQDVYVRVYEAAREARPDPVKPFVFAVARNMIIDRIRREHVVPIETVADLESLAVGADQPGPDRAVMAREELRRLQAALDRMPARCREAVVLKKIEGLSMREIATRMGISFKTVDRHLSDGAQYLADFIYGHADESRKKP
jgi:RNA polymerase sigma-70 factor (ECF subfamily)